MSHKVLSELGQVLVVHKENKTKQNKKTEHADLKNGEKHVKFESAF